MLKICLVEDEEYALKSLHQKIIDLNGPYEVVGVAYDGIDAIDVIEKQCPDVVLTDIRMPDMDGISLIDHMNQRNANAVFVIVSGYQEFEYAKHALKLGVEDYLLKPVVPGELRECLARCREKVRQKRNNKHIDAILSENVPAMHWGNVDHFLVYMIFGNAISSVESITHPDIFYISSHDIERKLHSRVNTPVFCFIGVCSNEKVAIIQRGDLSEKALLQMLHQLAAEMTEEYQCSVTISCQPMNASEVIGTQISLCRKIAVHNILLGTNNIVTGMKSNPYSTRGVNDVIAGLSLSIRQWQPDLLNSQIQSLFAQWEENRYPLRGIQMDLLYIANSLKHTIRTANTGDFTMDYHIDSIISVSNTFSDLAENFFHLLTELFGSPSLGDSQIAYPTHLVEQIDQYFRNHLSENLTLSMLCSEVNYSKVYLCRVFKKAKNSTPMDYFLQLKMERAKTLLAQCPSIPMKDIAESLGFSDVYYFSKVFKRIAGYPPSKVRDKPLMPEPEKANSRAEPISWENV